MTFTIDTGAPQRHISQPYDWVCDALPHDASADRIEVAMARAIIGEMHKHKTLKSVRKTLLYHWGRIEQLAENHPETFDEIILEFAELSTMLR